MRRGHSLCHTVAILSLLASLGCGREEQSVVSAPGGQGGSASGAGKGGGGGDVIPGGGNTGLPNAGDVARSDVGQPEGALHSVCEYGHAWRLHSQHGQNVSVVPQRQYVTSCIDGAGTHLFVSMPVQGASGRTQYVYEALLDESTGQFARTKTLSMDVCEDASGIAAAPDCSTVGVLCHRAYGSSTTDPPDADLITPYAKGATGERSWVLRGDNTANEDTNTEMWLYEYAGGDLSSAPTRLLVHKAVRATNTARPQGRYDLVYGAAQQRYAMALRTSMFTDSGNRHTADAFLVIARAATAVEWRILPDRGYPWACGKGHTSLNVPGYNAHTDQFAIACRTDIGAGLFFRTDVGGDPDPFHTVSFNGQGGNVVGGGVTSFVGLPDGGYLLALVGNPDNEVNTDGWTEGPPTRIGVMRFAASGEPVGSIVWLASSTQHFLGHAKIADLGKGRFLLGWSEQWRLGEGLDEEGMWTIRRRHSFQSAWAYYVVEIDETGATLTKARQIDGAGWGDVDRWASLGDGRVGWSYIADPELIAWDKAPSCGQTATPALFLYTSP